MNGENRIKLPTVLLWIVLLTMPYWMDAVGGYTGLATRMIVLGLAAMSLNFLLGFTGVLSFGHAAYFGLGAYGAGMLLKYLYPSTALAIIVGVLVGTIAAAIVGALIVKLRGIYFAMVTIAFGQMFYFIAFRWSSVTGGDDGLTGWNRAPLDLGFTQIDIVKNAEAFYYLVLLIFAVSVGIMALLLRSPFGRTLLAIRENERRARFLGIPVEWHMPKSDRPTDVRNGQSFLDLLHKPGSGLRDRSPHQNQSVNAYGDRHGKEGKHPAQTRPSPRTARAAHL